jgi:GDP-4-dehydro-6-deoxy-D-mannose reductase
VRILVTGAEGFVGGHLLKALAREGAHEVIAGCWAGEPEAGDSWEPEARIIKVHLDVTSSESVVSTIREHRPDWIFHLAGQSSVSRSFADPIGTWEVNATGTLRLAEALRAGRPGGTRLLVVSSAEVYGAVPAESLPVSETTALRPETPYGASKAAAEFAALQVAAEKGVEVVIARSFNHAGPGQDERFVFPSMARQLVRIRRGGAEPVLRVGNLEVHRDFLDVRDVIRAYLLLMQCGENRGIYNVCSGTSHSLLSLVTRLIDISGTGARLEVDPDRFRPVDIPVLYGDPAKLQALGWRAKMDLDQTLHDLLAEAELTTTTEVR